MRRFIFGVIKLIPLVMLFMSIAGDWNHVMQYILAAITALFWGVTSYFDGIEDSSN